MRDAASAAANVAYTSASVGLGEGDPDNAAAYAVTNAAANAANAAAAKGTSCLLAVATYHAANSANDVAAGVAFNADVRSLENGLSEIELAGRQLWQEQPPRNISDLWAAMKRNLVKRNENWDVWIDWYDARLAGKPSIEKLEIARVMIADEIWRQGPKVVNAEIKRLNEEYTEKEIFASAFESDPQEYEAFPGVAADGSITFGEPFGASPPLPQAPPLEAIPEPTPESGPVLEVTNKGLEVVSQPLGEDFDQAIQRSLHSRLQRLLPVLAEATHKVGNTHRELDFVIFEYADLIGQPFDQLDVASLWAVGTGLLAFRQAFANQANSTMTEPLEPGHFALLQQAAETHGGFILGFPKGRELTERADQARLSPDIVAQISAPTHTLLSGLSRARDFVEERTRPFFAAIDEAVIVNGWESARASHAAYVVTRNSLIALGKVLVWANANFATVVGSIVLGSVDPGFATTTHIIQFALQHAQTIASFVEPFPEMRVWFGSIIDHLNKCNPKQKRKG